MMILSDGDVTQYDLIRYLTMEDYITKLEHHAGRVEAERDAIKNAKTKK